MTQGETLTIFKETLWLILKISAPMLIASILIGLLISIFQAATQIHEQTLTFVPKIIAIALILVVAGSWMLTNLTEFFHYLIGLMIEL